MPYNKSFGGTRGIPAYRRPLLKKYAADTLLLCVPKWGGEESLYNFAPMYEGDFTTNTVGAGSIRKTYYGKNNSDEGVSFPNSGGTEWIFRQAIYPNPSGLKGVTIIHFGDKQISQYKFRKAGASQSDFWLLASGANLQWVWPTNATLGGVTYVANNHFSDGNDIVACTGITQRQDETAYLFKDGAPVSWDTDPGNPSSTGEVATEFILQATNFGDLNVILLAFINKAIPRNELRQITANPGLLFEPDSMPYWIPSGAAPPAWNNTMNEIAAPGAVNEITNANIQSVNEI